MSDPTDHAPRLFADDAAIVRVGEGLLARTLPRAEWTHEAHLGAIAWLVLARADIDLDRDIASIIRGYNAAVGGVNDDHHGYHDTITRCYLAGIRAHVARRVPGASLVETVNALLAVPEGARDWPLRFYSEPRLFSVAARRGFVPPDRGTLP